MIEASGRERTIMFEPLGPLPHAVYSTCLCEPTTRSHGFSLQQGETVIMDGFAVR